jgi:hypothetical protein
MANKKNGAQNAPRKKDQIQKSLTAAAKLLNRSMHRLALETTIAGNLSNAIEVMGEKLFTVTLHQPYCDDEQMPLGTPTTDFNSARAMAIHHHQQTGHVTDVIDSEQKKN